MFKDLVVIMSIILSISFLIILLYNDKLKNKLIKVVFMVLAITFMISILILDINYVYYLLRSLITYFWFPNYLIFVTTILISGVIFLTTLFKKKIKFKNKLKNYILFVISFAIYVIYLRQEIDITMFEALYSNISLILMRIETITFTIWLIITIIFRIGDKYAK